MKKIIVLLIALSILGTASFAFGGTLSMQFKAQEQTNWCWAASSQAVLGHIKAWESQCTIVNRGQNKNYCCQQPSSCNQTANGSVIAQLIGGSNGGVLSMSAIKQNIDASKPFVMGWYWTQGGGHALVGYGYSGNNVTYWDPWQGNGTTTANYNNVVSSSKHNWQETMTPNGSGPNPDPNPDPNPNPDQNSCKGHCGGKAPGGCYCDSSCQQYGDCCSDKTSVCGY